MCPCVKAAVFDQQGGVTFRMFDHESYELSCFFWDFILGFWGFFLTVSLPVTHEVTLAENRPS